MVVVVDNSVIIPLFMEDEDSSLAESIFSNTLIELHVPPLFYYEFGNALLVCQRRGRLRKEEVSTAQQMIQHSGLVVADTPSLNLRQKTQEIASLYQLSFYDASYLALALGHGGQLATLDKQLKKAAKAAGLLFE